MTNLWKIFKSKLMTILNPKTCFSLDRMILVKTGFWPTRSLKNFKFIGSVFFCIIFVLLAKLNYLRTVIEASNYKQVVVVLPEVITVIGFFLIISLLCAFKETLKELLNEFEIAWEMS